MTYKQFINSWANRVNRKIYLVSGGTSLVRQDAVHLIEEKYAFNQIDLVKSTFFLDEIAWYFVTSKSEFYNYRVVYWGSKEFDEGVAKKMIESCVQLPYVFVIVSEDKETMGKVYMKNFKSKHKVLFLDCSPRPSSYQTVRSYIQGRARVGGINLTKDAVNFMSAELSYDSIVETFKMLRPFRGVTFDKKELTALNLYGVDQELFLVNYFLKHGKHKLMNFYDKALSGISVRRFLQILFGNLMLILRAKCLKGGDDKKNMVELGLDSMYIYLQLKKQAKMFDMRNLYRRAELLVRVLNYSRFQNSIYFLIMYW